MLKGVSWIICKRELSVIKKQFYLCFNSFRVMGVLMLSFNSTTISSAANGYIAGSADGIVTVRGKPASRKIWLLNAKDMVVEQVVTSLKNGHYLFMALDLSKRYLVMVRDYKKEYEPFVWDYVKPADDLTIAEQQALWQSWQTN